MSDPRATPLLKAYFDRREELKRFFAARFGSTEQAEDMVQELYLKLVALPDDADVANPPAYLYRLAMNLMLDQVRSQTRAAARDGAWRQAHRQSPAGEDVADEPTAEDVLASRIRLQRLAEAVDALPDKTRRVFHLHKFEGLTHAETAKRLGMSPRMVEKHVRAALRALMARKDLR